MYNLTVSELFPFDNSNWEYETMHSGNFIDCSYISMFSQRKSTSSRRRCPIVPAGEYWFPRRSVSHGWLYLLIYAGTRPHLTPKGRCWWTDRFQSRWEEDSVGSVETVLINRCDNWISSILLLDFHLEKYFVPSWTMFHTKIYQKTIGNYT